MPLRAQCGVGAEPQGPMNDSVGARAAWPDRGGRHPRPWLWASKQVSHHLPQRGLQSLSFQTHQAK